jgi:hypothetical protein
MDYDDPLIQEAVIYVTRLAAFSQVKVDGRPFRPLALNVPPERPNRAESLVWEIDVDFDSQRILDELFGHDAGRPRGQKGDEN